MTSDFQVVKPFDIVVPFNFKTTGGANFKHAKPGKYQYSFEIDSYKNSRCTPEEILTMIVRSVAYQIKDDLFTEEDE